MATVTGYTAARMKEIEDAAIVDGVVVGDDLFLTRYDGVQINAGNVRGAQGPIGSSTDTAVKIVTSGTRPASPYVGLFIYETDTHYVFSWNGSSWVYRGGTIICTSSTRPTLNLFAGLTIYETDTRLFFVWNGAAWIYRGGTVVCTSVTRPSTPVEGLAIYETDTKRSYTYNDQFGFQHQDKCGAK